ncbi:hypothetical protein JGK52_04360 [Cytobacillus oceanisediminis]|uniref:Ger(x)C family spore germination protein n=1 Tax=Cytobacillus oceanisediminis TaxID=665099 RepID=UPI001D13766F|nr:hypothetical protein [Cytobacillus oceanisediminis]MCC3645916.1 hypothetical protein [Cytobacillus oceanisediminis]
MKYLYVLFILLSVAAVFLAPLDKHELNELSFSFAMGVDHAEDGYEVSLQLINPAAVAGKSQVPNSPYVVYKATGKTIDTALERISVNISRYFKIAIFTFAGMNLAKSRMAKVKPQVVTVSILVIILLLSYAYAENLSQHLEIGLKFVPLFIHLPLAILLPILLFIITFIKMRSV